MVYTKARYIRTLSELCDYFGADTPVGLNRRIYKDTDCGASISVLRAFPLEPCGMCVKFYAQFQCGATTGSGECDCPKCQGFCTCDPWVHNGRIGWDRLDNTNAIGFTIQTIVEGSDATVDSDTFMFPVKKSDVRRWIADMEEQASALWNEANTDDDEDEDLDGTHTRE